MTKGTDQSLGQFILYNTGELVITAPPHKKGRLFLRDSEILKILGCGLLFQKSREIIGGGYLHTFASLKTVLLMSKIFRLRRKNTFTPLKTDRLVSKIFRLRRKMSQQFSEFLGVRLFTMFFGVRLFLEIWNF